MSVIEKQAALALCSAALVALSTSVFAQPAQQRHAQRVQPQAEAPVNAPHDDRYPFLDQVQPTEKSSRAAKAARTAKSAAPATGLFGSNSLVAEARRHIGTNPTGRSSLWCGAFMDMVLRRTGHSGGGNLARAYANYGTRVSGPQVGAIAVMNRGGGGHVGVVSGVDPNGNPIVISGNHNGTTAESVYPRGRIIAYVMPGG